MSKLSISTIAATLCGSLLLTACPSDDTTGTGTDSESSSSSTGPVVTTMPPTTMTTDDTTTTVDPDTTVGLDTSSSGGTTAAESTTTSEPGDSTTDASTGSSGSTTDASTGGSTTGEPPTGDGYGDCANNDPAIACLADEECIGDGTGNAVCLEQNCNDAADCAVPATGNSVPTCLDVTGDMVNDCYLDCSGGEACPDGMICVLDFVCIWEQAPPPPGMCPDQDIGNTVPQTVMGDNTGLGDDHVTSCGDGGGEDAMYQFTAPAAGSYTFDTAGSMLGDTILSILDGCGGMELDCNDDVGGGVFTSEVTVNLAAGQQVIVVVEGYGGDVGPFTLNISSP